MTLMLRPLSESDIEPATQCGLAAWISAILPSLSSFAPSDIPRIEQLFRSFLMQQVSSESQPGDLVVVADIGSEIAGFYCLECDGGELTDLWLAPKWHGQGIGSRMLDDAQRQARLAGYEHLRLKVLASNSRALAFYHKEGMEEVGRTTQFDPALRQTVAKILMHKRLT